MGEESLAMRNLYIGSQAVRGSSDMGQKGDTVAHMRHAFIKCFSRREETNYWRKAIPNAQFNSLPAKV